MARNKFDVDERLESPFQLKHLIRAGKYIGKYKFQMIMALLLSGGLSAVLLLHKGAPFNAALGVMVRETIVSLPIALVLIHPAFTYFHRITDPR